MGAIGNVVDNTYNGVYHVNVTLHFCPAEEKYGNSGVDDDLDYEFESKEFKIPPNVYRVVLQVHVSFHENVDFWYGNYPNEYIEVNNRNGVPGHGPFRKVVVSLDDKVATEVSPFTVIYTGGVNPLLWIPITRIGSFDLNLYDIKITPLLAKILDGKVHSFGLSITNVLNIRLYIDASFHLWLDKKNEKTEGRLLNYSVVLTASLTSNFTGFDGSFTINVSRSIIYSGWVNSSHGKVVT
ncbi:Hypothetical predicted protein [Olea europaea subsp. europaea]|uniref:Peptide N-acetyl-beta-D-glucosaminyl asparaginase amidase A N-terminal domain-containing protein n=1 Tax=Olea europaea subsp. europaea TaxID=158383 RepID=A0A8S0PJR3_OLEEU|nr:Hypothetical predicted protein [Olea europaea subsp. europaea]